MINILVTMANIVVKLSKITLLGYNKSYYGGDTGLKSILTFIFPLTMR